MGRGGTEDEESEQGDQSNLRNVFVEPLHIDTSYSRVSCWETEGVGSITIFI